jgi:hypothetical protein
MPFPRHLSVQLDLESDSLSGTISTDGQDAEPFHNWLELMSAVEGRRPQADGRGPERAERGPDDTSLKNEESER